MIAQLLDLIGQFEIKKKPLKGTWLFHEMKKFLILPLRQLFQKLSFFSGANLLNKFCPAHML